MYDELIRAFKARRINCQVFKEVEDVLSYLVPLIKQKKIGVGDSITFDEIGLYEYLRRADCLFLDKYDPALSREAKRNLYTENFSADLFFSGVNAISMSGKLYNLDGNGSRVAPIIYGPEKVILISGTNKICSSDEAAIERVRNTAAPMDAVRLKKKTLCAKTGKCMDCKSPDRICNYMTVVEGQFNPERIELILIEGTFGY